MRPAGRPGAPGLRVGDVLEVTVEKAVYRGLALARHEGQVVFVPRGLPGDRVRVRVESVGRGYVRALAGELLASSPARRPSPCPYVPRCGGCTYQEADYPAQLQMKAAIVRESLERAGAAFSGEIVVAGSEEQGWRTRATLHVSAGHDGVAVGLYEEGTHRVVDIEHCLQLSPAMSRAARGLQAALASRPEVAGRVREIDLAESQDGKALVAALETDLTVEAASGLGWLAHETPWLTGLGVVAGRERRFLPLRGDPHVEASVLGVALRAHVRSFFQANRFLLEDLARAVVEATPPGGAVLDLYAGVGLFSLPLAARAERVRAVEWSAVAVDDFQANAARAGLRNVSIEPADVGAALARLPAGQVESVVLDPPRAGAGPAVVRAVLARRPRSVVYVSCDPPTLGRDLKAFADGSYRVTSVRAFDLFPDTFHVETLVTIAPAERSSPPGALSL